MEKQVINIRLDYMQGPIWISDIETGQPMTGIDLIDDDKIVISLNHEISLIYSNFYDLTLDDKACSFDYKKEKENKFILLDLLSKLISRLNEINDGSYIINDEETSRISAL